MRPAGRSRVECSSICDHPMAVCVPLNGRVINDARSMSRKDEILISQFTAWILSLMTPRIDTDESRYDRPRIVSSTDRSASRVRSKRCWSSMYEESLEISLRCEPIERISFRERKARREGAGGNGGEEGGGGGAYN